VVNGDLLLGFINMVISWPWLLFIVYVDIYIYSIYSIYIYFYMYIYMCIYMCTSLDLGFYRQFTTQCKF
jgi:hypothetical protein